MAAWYAAWRFSSLPAAHVLLAATKSSESSSADGFEQHERDLPLGLGLVAGVVAVVGRQLGPDAGPLLGAGDAGVHRLLGLPSQGNLHLRVVAEVEEPGRMGVVAAAGGDDDEGVAVSIGRGEHH